MNSNALSIDHVRVELQLELVAQMPQRRFRLGHEVHGLAVSADGRLLLGQPSIFIFFPEVGRTRDGDAIIRPKDRTRLAQAFMEANGKVGFDALPVAHTLAVGEDVSIRLSLSAGEAGTAGILVAGVAEWHRALQASDDRDLIELRLREGMPLGSLPPGTGCWRAMPLMVSTKRSICAEAFSRSRTSTSEACTTPRISSSIPSAPATCSPLSAAAASIWSLNALTSPDAGRRDAGNGSGLAME